MSDKPVNIKSIFNAALDIPAGEARSAFLDAECSSNNAVREQVEHLLAAEAALGSFLDRPAVVPVSISDDTEDSPTVLFSPEDRKPGDRIGRYKLLQQIGEGGFGTVFMAEQSEPVRRQVAVKIIKPGMDSKEVIARFEAERQALALMDHTNIARVFDAGATSDGRPYFVMELVKGVPITTYCDQHQLDTRARLKLFIPACQAVQHAHQKGIIHRDLKPSNIMVTLYDGVPVPKIIDFGIAKATSQRLTEKTLFTAYGQFLGTPQYMSPEQSELSALDIDTRADVYSLGATLYEILLGKPPFDSERLRSAGFAEVMRIIKEEEPLLPSQRLSTLGEEATTIARQRHVEPISLGRLLRGDLDWIVMKALDKDRNRRYATPNDLAADIERHLNLDPIQARPISTWNRRWRWCRKNPVVSSLSGALLLVLAIGFAGMALLWWRAEEAAERESLQRVKAEFQGDRADREADLAKGRAEQASEAAHRADRAAKQAGDYLYAARMSLAQRAWDDGQVGEVEELLRATMPVDDEPDRRSLEWNYLSRLCNSNLGEFRMDGFGAQDLTYSPDGQLMAASGYQHLKVWLVPQGVLLRSFSVNGLAQCAAFSPDGKHIVSAVGEGNLEYANTITAWNIESGAPRTIAQCRGAISRLVFSPDGEYLAAAITFSPITVIVSEEDQLRSGEIKVWRVADGEEIYSIASELPNLKDRSKVFAAATEAAAIYIDFSPDGKKLLGVTGFGKVKVWNAVDGTELMELEGGVGQAIFSADGATIISAEETWDSSNGSVIERRPNAEPWSNCDRERSAWSARGVYSICNVATRSKIAELRAPESDSHQLALSPDGWRVASSAPDAIRIWDAHGSQQADTIYHSTTQKIPFLHAPYLDASAISPDGLRVATVVGGTMPFHPASIKIWDRITGKELVSTEEKAGNCIHLEFSGDGSQLAAAFYGEGTIVWNAHSGERLRRFENEGHYATYNPTGKLIATVGEQNRKGIVVIRDAATGEQVSQAQVDWHSVDRVAFHPNGKLLFLGGRLKWEQPGNWQEDDVIAVCQVTDGLIVASRQGPIRQMTSMDHSPDGTILAVASRSQVFLLEATSLELLNSLDEGATQAIFSPVGDRLVTTDSYTSRMWDVDSLQEVLRLRGAGTGLSFDASGHYLVAASRSADVRLTTDHAAIAHVWDFRPVRDDKIERIAIGLLRHLGSQNITDVEVEERIRLDRTIDAATREHALDLWAGYQARKSLVRESADSHVQTETSAAEVP